jgi:hypothetical protein
MHQKLLKNCSFFLMLALFNIAHAEVTLEPVTIIYDPITGKPLLALHINIHNNNHIPVTTNTSANAENGPHQLSSVQTTTTTTGSQTNPSWWNQEAWQKQFNSAATSITAHPKTIFATLVFSSYVWINYQLRQTNQLLQEHNSWCNWKSSVPLAHLQLTDGQELLEQLKIDFYKKYALKTDDIDSCNYILLFVNDIKHELKLLENYACWQKLLKTIWCQKLFYFPCDLTVIEEKKTRLLFIFDFFMKWYSENHCAITRKTSQKLH